MFFQRVFSLEPKSAKNASFVLKCSLTVYRLVNAGSLLPGGMESSKTKIERYMYIFIIIHSSNCLPSESARIMTSDSRLNKSKISGGESLLIRQAQFPHLSINKNSLHNSYILFLGFFF